MVSRTEAKQLTKRREVPHGFRTLSLYKRPFMQFLDFRKARTLH